MCRSKAFGGISVDNRGAVYFPVRLCFVTLSTMSVSHCVIIWRQRPGGGGGEETASSFSCCEPRPVPPEAACLLKSSQETLGLTFNPLDHPKTPLSDEFWSSGGDNPSKCLQNWLICQKCCLRFYDSGWIVSMGYFGSIFILLYPTWTTRWLQRMINLVLNFLHILSDVRISGSKTQHAWYEAYLVISTCNKVTKLEKGHRNSYIAYFYHQYKEYFLFELANQVIHFYDFFDWEFRLFPSEMWLFLILREKKSVSIFFFCISEYCLSRLPW